LSSRGPWPELAYVETKLERLSEQRGDRALMAKFAASPDARAVIAAHEMMILKKSGEKCDALFTLDEAQKLGAAGQPLFIGLHEEKPRLGFSLPAEKAELLRQRSDLHVTDLRSVTVKVLVPSEQLEIIAINKALHHWHARHGFCANCGHGTEMSDAGWRRTCSSCKSEHFARTDPCVIMLAIDGERCLLARSHRFVPGMFSCLAGFIEPGESMEDAARRETQEESGIKIGRVRYFASQPWPFPHSLMIGCFAEATSSDLNFDKNEIEDGRWFSREEAAAMLKRSHEDGLTTPPPSAIAHHIIRAYVERGADVLKD
jgi:NAD+ diphosphatase